MLQAVKHQLPSPLQRGQSVLTLACGHLWSWNSSEPAPAEIDCIHCDKLIAAAPELLRRLKLMCREWREAIGTPEENRTPGDCLERSEALIAELEGPLPR